MNELGTAQQYLKFGGTSDFFSDCDLLSESDPMWQYKPPLPPLTWFVVTGRLEIAELLLDHGAYIEMPDLTGATAILYASKYAMA